MSMAKLKARDPHQFRHKMRLHQRNECALCGGPMQGAFSDAGDDTPSVDHIRPISKGGLSNWANIQIVHKGCNNQRGLLNLRQWKKQFRLKEWRQMIAGHRSMFNVVIFRRNAPLWAIKRYGYRHAPRIIAEIKI